MQAEQLRDMAAQAESPLILAGDFNTTPDGPEIKLLANELKDAMSGSNLATFPTKHPGARIDYVFISKNCAIINADTVKSDASDHLAVVAVVEVK